MSRKEDALKRLACALGCAESENEVNCNAIDEIIEHIANHLPSEEIPTFDLVNLGVPSITIAEKSTKFDGGVLDEMAACADRGLIKVKFNLLGGNLIESVAPVSKTYTSSGAAQYQLCILGYVSDTVVLITISFGVGSTGGDIVTQALPLTITQ